MKSSGRTSGYYLAPLAIVFVLLANLILEVHGSAQKNGPDRAENSFPAAAAQPAVRVALPGDSLPSSQNKKQAKPSSAASSAKAGPAINHTHQKPALMLIITAEEAASAAGLPDRNKAIAEVARAKGRQIAYSNNLNPDAIEAIDVYKETAASIFGEKGRNGVIVITLKKGLSRDSVLLKKAPEKKPAGKSETTPKTDFIIRGQNKETAEKPYMLVLEKPVAGLREQIVSQETINQILLSGKPIANLKEVETKDIASMSVLKGESAKAFGDKGKNGVVLITLKTEVPAKAGTKPETSGDWLIYPNPSANLFKINVDLATSEDLQITAYDTQNRVVGTIAKGSYWKGGHEFEWDASHLKPGYYIISLTKGKGTWTKRVIIK